MKIIIEANSKEIADLVLGVQSQQTSININPDVISQCVLSAIHDNDPATEKKKTCCT